jgi:hypothetical protein
LNFHVSESFASPRGVELKVEVEIGFRVGVKVGASCSVLFLVTFVGIF